jgi:hypothetical protein
MTDIILKVIQLRKYSFRKRRNLVSTKAGLTFCDKMTRETKDAKC